MDFEQSIWLAVIDKIILGLFLLVIGFFVNRFLEEYKSELTLRNEMAKTRMEHVSKIFSKINTWEATVTALHRRWAEMYREGASEDEKRKVLTPLFEDSKNLSELVKKEVHKNRMWLNEKLYEYLLDYNNTMIDFISVIITGNDKRCEELYTKLSSMRLYYDELLQRLLYPSKFSPEAP